MIGLRQHFVAIPCEVVLIRHHQRDISALGALLEKLKERCSGAARLLRERIGWNGLGVALSLTILAIALTTLFHALRDVDIGGVVAAMKATPRYRILWAAVFVGGGYLTLTFYDMFALRTIGRRDVPYRVAALASFTSYAIGHNIGFTVFSGGAVRFRIYSAWGVTVPEVAKIAFVTGLTFWLGNAFTLGLGVAYDPRAAGAIDHLPVGVNRAAAVAVLAAIACYLAWLVPRKRRIGRNRWQITLPDARLTCLQIGIGVVDLTFTALGMYMLMPSEPGIEFARLLVTFVLATLLGFASHTPGGLGVFDAAMLFALLQFEKEQLLAALLLFRLLYYIVPFALALMVLAARELRLGIASMRARQRP
jgi:uncharacterized membrane protein YbhN (UPF0104 family)